MDQVNQFKHFKKMQDRYWEPEYLLDPTDLFSDMSTKIRVIESRNFGSNENKYRITTQAKIIINGLSLKIYDSIKNSIIFIEEKQYIAAISVLRLCLEHIAMMSYFEGKLTKYAEKIDLVALQILLFSFCHGERVYYVEGEEDLSQGKRNFSSRAEHVSSALRFFDKKYAELGLGMQIIYDMFSNHSHVTPTSSVRMLYRQKVWNEPERITDFKRIKLSTKSNSMERFASIGLESVLKLFKAVEVDVINKEKEISTVLESAGFQIHHALALNPNSFQIVDQFIKKHDEAVNIYNGKLTKYLEPKAIQKTINYKTLGSKVKEDEK